MDASKIATFMQLAGQSTRLHLQSGDPKERALGAQLLLSEVLEYVIHGLGVIPEVEGVKITAPDSLTYHPSEPSDPEEMVDGLADVAYTMYWNACAFGVPLEKAFELVCDNNLEKFVLLSDWRGAECQLPQSEWHCQLGVTWPPEVVRVDVVKVGHKFYAVGKDSRGKVRKPSTYRPVDLTQLVANS